MKKGNCPETKTHVLTMHMGICFEQNKRGSFEEIEKQ